MNRRDFLSATVAMGALSVLPMPSRLHGSASAQHLAPKHGSQHYRPPYRLGLGCAPLGNSSSIAITEAEAQAVLENAWESGIRYYDTSPFYGLTKSERRLGRLLGEKPRASFVISSKIGRVFSASRHPRESAWANPAPFDYQYDYSASGARRSIEDSLQRLGLSSLDVVFIHDLSPDNGGLKGGWEEHFNQALKGAMPELIKMREEGIIKGWGLGVNTLPPLLRALRESDPDILLSACHYTLIDHKEALNTLFPACEQRGVSLVIGSPLNNGFLAGRNRFNYDGDRKPQANHIEKRKQLSDIAGKYKVDLRTAALQFCAAPGVVASVIPGARGPLQAAENLASMNVDIPFDFWEELKKDNLIEKNAPLPTRIGD